MCETDNGYIDSPGEAQRVRAVRGSAGAVRWHLPHRARVQEAGRPEAAGLPLPLHPL